MTRVWLDRSQIDPLIQCLWKEGFDVIGPVARDGAIVYDRVESAAELPKGVTDEQAPGRYRLHKQDSPAMFGYVLGPQSWKKYLHPANAMLFRARNERSGDFRILPQPVAASSPPKPFAFLGVRACELAAIARQDRVLLEGPFHDAIYGANREGTFVVAMQCTQSAATCFCASMGTGPGIVDAKTADLTLTELAAGFVAEAGSRRGRSILAKLESRAATEEESTAAADAVRSAATSQQRHLQTEGLRETLQRNFEHPEWDAVAGRCLDCGNCTMVCPTCFCTNIEDVSDVSGEHSERWRRWDSCFTTAFSYIHGGSVRNSPRARYRQWMTHKLAYWHDQFGSSGCVGCGRCITWCPAGIDITEEARVLQKG